MTERVSEDLTPDEEEVGARLAEQRPVPGARFRGALRRHLQTGIRLRSTARAAAAHGRRLRRGRDMLDRGRGAGRDRGYLALADSFLALSPRKTCLGSDPGLEYGLASEPESCEKDLTGTHAEALQDSPGATDLLLYRDRSSLRWRPQTCTWLWFRRRVTTESGTRSPMASAGR